MTQLGSNLSKLKSLVGLRRIATLESEIPSCVNKRLYLGRRQTVTLMDITSLEGRLDTEDDAVGKKTREAWLLATY